MKQIYEFEDFRADPSEQLLLHDGQPVALTPKVFETLLILLESEGRLIDKEDFISRLWPGVFVEDVALAKNISHLRRILADGKNGTEMIQTVPKRGYRFAVPVRKVVDPPADHSGPGDPAEVIPPEAKTRSRMVWAIALLLLVASGAGVFLLLRHKRPVFTEKDTVVLADFTNTTGDPVFDGTLRQGLAVQLEQSPFLNLISEEQMQTDPGPDGPAGHTRSPPRLHGKFASEPEAPLFWKVPSPASAINMCWAYGPRTAAAVGCSPRNRHMRPEKKKSSMPWDRLPADSEAGLANRSQLSQRTQQAACRGDDPVARSA